MILLVADMPNDKITNLYQFSISLIGEKNMICGIQSLFNLDESDLIQEEGSIITNLIKLCKKSINDATNYFGGNFFKIINIVTS